MRFDILTLLPDFFKSPLDQGVIGRAAASGLIDVQVHNIRDHTTDRHRTADDTPYGGGHGMVMKPEPVVRSLEAIGAADEGGPEEAPGGTSGEGDAARSGDSGGNQRPFVVLVTPQGRPFTQTLARSLASRERIVVICGRYEGVDERIRSFVDLELSIGDYILTGGEAAALVIIDAVGRLIPGVLGEPESTTDESFTRGLLEYPQYTRPPEWRGMRVPDVLLSGNHAEIEKWRRRQALLRTLERRPELLEAAELTAEEKKILVELKTRG